VTPDLAVFTARDRSGHRAAGRHRQARVPARQSARRPIISREIIGRSDQRERSAPPGYPGARRAATSPSLKSNSSARRVTGRDARGPDLPPGTTTTSRKPIAATPLN